MPKGLVTIDQKAARSIAIELFALMRKELMRIDVAAIMPDEYLNLKEAAAFLGCSETTLYKKAKKGEVPGAKAGGSWRFPRRDLEKYMRREPLKQ